MNFKLINYTLPTKEQLEKLSKDVEDYEYTSNKNDCKYMMDLITETLSKATKSGPNRLYEHTDINNKKLNNLINIGLKCVLIQLLILMMNLIKLVLN